ncbi:MAG: succinylglutamate desuccinylase/aspartoacylase family protein [Phormidium sp. BM_Day4_Bin.17]|nr:succinylglutamate desuccinylase/aspartoacylase family protein [Phormidium sp. BM_Day4_Bin.17]UCJ11592.1 MAG: succinylglutamate desuccinylase/aspartoacylase family protein [Phormidium sp. PBR-2020]
MHPGKKAYLQANLHGAELSGNAVIYQLIQFLCSLDSSQLQGEIWLVPTCNPLATNQRSHHYASGRYNPYTGMDWNRIFWDYEKESESSNQMSLADFVKCQVDQDPKQIEAQFSQALNHRFQEQLKKENTASGLPFEEQYRYRLQSLCLDANYVLDLHSSTNQSIDYLYCFQGREQSAKYFLLNTAILLDTYDGDAFDEAFLKPWLSLEIELAKSGKSVQFDREAWTLELGSGMQINPDSVYRGVRGIKNYLVSKGVLNINRFPLIQTASKTVQFFPKSKTQKYYAQQGGMLQSRVLLGAWVTSGQLLYQLLVFNREGRLPQLVDVHSEESGLVYDLSSNASVNQGEYILEILTHPQ